MGSKIDINKLNEDVWQALKAWHKNTKHSHLGYLYRLQQLLRQGEYTTRQATNQLLMQAIDSLEQSNAQYAEFLRSRFIDGKQIKQLTAQFGVGEGIVYKTQKEAIYALAETLFSMEQTAKITNRDLLEKRLPTPNPGKVIGIEEKFSSLKKTLISPQAPWIVLLTGLGGIGKTTLADTVTRRLLLEGWFADVGWVSAKANALNSLGVIKTIHQPALTVDKLIHSLVIQLFGDVFKESRLSYHQAFSSLQRRLKEKPHLIVIDNLETVEDIQELIPALNRLANPTKFLLTSRYSLFGEDGVFHFPVPGLNVEHSIQLIREEARIRNIPFLIEASDEQLSPIYNIVGGNPLALRLVVGQAHFRPLDIILQSLKSARGQPVEKLYAYIYKQTWEGMSERTRQLFLAMPFIIDEGGSLDQIAYITQLDPIDLHESLQQLISMNLIDVKPGLQGARYSIHNLTRIFLEQGPAQWI